MEALTVQLQNCPVTWAVLLCIVPVQLPLKMLFFKLMSSDLGHLAFIGVIVICLFLVGACSTLVSLGLAYTYILLVQHSAGSIWGMQLTSESHGKSSHQMLYLMSLQLLVCSR